MHTKLDTTRPPAPDETWAPDSAALRSRALDLQRSRDKGIPQPLLRGKNIGLLCESDTDAEAAMLRAAATELGAKVASIRPSLSDLNTPQDIARTARILGRLYDALLCQGVAPHLVRQLRHDAGVPVLEGIPSWITDPAFADGMPEPASSEPPDRCRYLLQAALLSTLR